MTFEICANKFGKPYLKKMDRPRKPSVDGRGVWIPIGRLSESGIDYVNHLNKLNGYTAVLDEEGVYRVLVLTD